MEIQNNKIDKKVTKECKDELIDILADNLRIKLLEDYHNLLQKNIDKFINAEETNSELKGLDYLTK